jgi:hypothetical protein
MHTTKQDCALLAPCPACAQVVEVAGMPEHLLDECDQKANYVSCDVTGEEYQSAVLCTARHTICTAEYSYRLPFFLIAAVWKISAMLASFVIKCARFVAALCLLLCPLQRICSTCTVCVFHRPSFLTIRLP